MPLFSCSWENSIKPTLKKISKYDNKFAKLQKKAAEFNFRNQLKTVKKKEFTMDEGEKGKPEWALSEKEGKSKSISEPPPEVAEVNETAVWKKNRILLNLYELFQSKDATMVEINPFAEDSHGDCK